MCTDTHVAAAAATIRGLEDTIRHSTGRPARPDVAAALVGLTIVQLREVAVQLDAPAYGRMPRERLVDHIYYGTVGMLASSYGLSRNC